MRHWDPIRSLVLVGIVLGLGLPQGFAAGAEAEKPIGAAGKPVVLPLLERRRGFYLVGELNGRAGLLRVDTGTTLTHVYGDVAARLGLKTIARKNVSTFEGKQQEPLSILDHLAVGPIRLQSIPVFIAGEKRVPVEGVLGVLGMDVLGRQPFALDFRDLTLTLYDSANFAPPSGTAFPIRAHAENPIVRASIENCRGWFEIDTGYSDTVLLSRAFVDQNTQLIFDRPRIHMGPSWSAPDQDTSTRWNEADILGKKLSEENGSYEITGRLGARFAGLIGTAHLGSSILTIDMQLRKVWVEHLPDETNADLLRRVAKQAKEHQTDLSPLIACIGLSRTSAVGQLLESGSSANEEDPWGISALVFAAGRGKVDLLDLLLGRRAKVDAVYQSNGFTALTFACRFGRLEAVKRLIAAGADVNHAGKIGDTPLFRASEAGQVEIVKLLLANHAKVDAALETGETPLLAACANGDAEIAGLLLEQKADPNAAGPLGNCLSYACYNSSFACVKLLLDHGADANRRAGQGPTPLIAAASMDSKGAAECVRLLLAAGADASVRGNPRPGEWLGSTALDMATESGEVDSVMQLLAQQHSKAKGQGKQGK